MTWLSALALIAACGGGGGDASSSGGTSSGGTSSSSGGSSSGGTSSGGSSSGAAPTTYAVRGAVQGLTAPVVLQINGAGDTTVAKDGGFTLAQRLPNAAGYLVTVKSSGPGQSCTVSKGSGTIAAADLGTVNVLCSAVTPRRAYVAAAGSLNTYPLDGTTGALAPDPTSTVTSGPIPIEVAVAPDGKHLFVTDYKWQSVSSYAIDTAGDPSFVGSFATDSQPRAAAVDPVSRYVYVANEGANSLSSFAIDAATGKLTELAGSPMKLSNMPVSLTINPSGTRLFEVGPATDYVYGFAIGAGGGLTGISPKFRLDVTGFAISPDGKFGFGTSPNIYDVQTWVMDSNGAPTSRVLGIPVPKATGSVSGPPVLDPTGKHLYQLAETGSNSAGALYAFSVGTDGGLTPVAGSPFPAGSNPRKTVVEPSGRFVYVMIASGNKISVLARDAATGALTPVTNTPFPAGPLAFALSP